MLRDVLAHGLKMVTVIRPVITQHVIGMEVIASVKQQCLIYEIVNCLFFLQG